ncbi:hypothetical protein Hdeb2414_s0003g00102531 [Helianthus debilis subsp. tardiflorus]
MEVGAAWHNERRRRLLNPVLGETGSLFVFSLFINKQYFKNLIKIGKLKIKNMFSFC